MFNFKNWFKPKTVYVFPKFYFNGVMYDWCSGMSVIKEFEKLFQKLKNDNIVVFDENTRRYIINK